VHYLACTFKTAKIMKRLFRSRWFVWMILLTAVPIGRAAKQPQAFGVADWQTSTWTFASLTMAQTTPVFNSATNQSLKLYLTNVPSGAVLTFDWAMTTGVGGDSMSLRKNGLAPVLASLTSGSQTNKMVVLEAGTYYLDFFYTRTGTTGGSTQAELSNVVLHLPPGIAPGSIVVTPGAGSVKVEWVSDEDSKGQLQYGSSTNLNLTSALEGSFATNHSITVSNWAANVPMNFRIVDTDALPQVKTNALMRSFSIPMLSISKASATTVRTRWNADTNQWRLLEAVQLGAITNAVTNAVSYSGITNSVTLPSTNPPKFFRLERTAAPGYVELGP